MSYWNNVKIYICQRQNKKNNLTLLQNFDNEKFEKELKMHLSSTLDSELFHLAFKATLDQFAPSKQNARDDNQSLMIKIFRKAITKISNLKNKFNKDRNAKNCSSYKQQRSYCSNLLKETKITGIFM